MTEIEELNKYNATHYVPWGENEDVEFSYESEDFEDWLQRNESKKGSPRSEKTIARSLQNARRYFIAMGTLSAENVKQYKYGLRDKDTAPATINATIIALNLYTQFLSDKYNAPQLKTMKLKTVKVQPKQFIDNVISRADFDFLINEAKKDYKHPNIYLGAKIMGTTGVRRCELFQVKVEHIKHGCLDVIGKGNKQRRIYFPKNARDEIMDYMSHLDGGESGYVIRRWKSTKDTYLANTRDKGDIKEQLLFEREFNQQFARAAQRYGISSELMHPHGFRHFFAKEFLKNRLDISLLADLLGHSSLDITRIYLKMTSREQADVVNEVVTW